jgi:two-component system chemotaxis sensor kinase CheA
MTNNAPPENAAGFNALASDPELLGDFILESTEHLTTIESQLLTLEQDPANAEAIHAIFRGFHTIKGLAGFLELVAVHEVAHEVETILDLARTWKLRITPLVIDRILEGKDYLAGCLRGLEQMLTTGVPPVFAPNGPLLITLRTLIDTQNTGNVETEASAVQPRVEEPCANADAKVAEPPEASSPPEVSSPLEASNPPEASNIDLQELALAVMAEPPDDASLHERGEKPGASRVESRAPEGRLVRVDTAKLDFLVDMVGEMVIAQSLVRHDPDLACESKPRLARNLSQLARITEEVQKTAMSMRMVPVGQLFQKMSRLVRDLSKKSGKQVELQMSGEDTELDRHIVEELADPLMHMVRNSIDHGLEPADERERAGKSATGTLLLRASHQAGQIVIKVADDGRGLNRDKILNKARAKGLIAAGDLPSDREIFDLIFQPGFSTAEQVTDVSGRGVGMDVVRRHLQKMRGHIEIESVAGQGTTFFLKLPLTLAIIDGLVVSVGEERYILPIFAVREMLRPTEEMISTVQGRSEMALVRGSLLPIVRLHQRFSVQPRSLNPWESLLIVAESGGKRFCLLVDELIGKQEVVIKSLGATLQGITGIAGGAILGDGRVGLILDLAGLYGASHSA